MPDQPTFPTRKGWTLPTLERLGVTPDDAGRFVFQLQTDDGEPCGVVRYADDGAEPKMRRPGTKRDLWPRPEVIEGPTLFVVEGEPDALSMAELGLPAVAYPGTGKWSDEWPHRLVLARTTGVAKPSCSCRIARTLGGRRRGRSPRR